MFADALVALMAGIAGLAFLQNLRRGHDGLATQPHVTFESLPFAELAKAM